MEYKTLTDLFSRRLFKIPDYQRGYAWEDKQLMDFVEDLDALVSDNTSGRMRHYTGTIVTYQPPEKPVETYGVIERLEVVDVVDGQQRLTTATLYLSVIIRYLSKRGQKAYEAKVPAFLFAGSLAKVRLNNSSGDFFLDLLKTGRANNQALSPHEMRLQHACSIFELHLDKKLQATATDVGTAYLEQLFHAITGQLVFTYYTISEECEIGMTFELMNSRGKKLTDFELLKNYLMHWTSRNVDEAERTALTSLVNKCWKNAYVNLGACDGDEDQCLRIAWTLHCNHTPKNWAGYAGFKEASYMPLRGLSVARSGEVRRFIESFVEGLAVISKHYAQIYTATPGHEVTEQESLWLSKIHRVGNIANFLPLMVAGRLARESHHVTEAEYIALLKALECYAYRVFVYEGKRSNAGSTNFYRWAKELFDREQSIADITTWAWALVENYSSTTAFRESVEKPFEWYHHRRLLNYTLFEYELHLLETEGKKPLPVLSWDSLSDTTLEHIYPQTPDERSHWKKVWDESSAETYLHDIGNLVLTLNNSNYRNFDFDRKKGTAGQRTPCYAASDIRQERNVAGFADWTPAAVQSRRNEILKWVVERWATHGLSGPLSGAEASFEDDEE